MFLEILSPVPFAPDVSFVTTCSDSLMTNPSDRPMPINLTPAEIRDLVMEVLG